MDPDTVCGLNVRKSLRPPGTQTRVTKTEYPKWGYPDRGYPDRGTVPAIAFKVDILAANVNFMNMDNQAFFNILGTPFEL